MTNRPCRRLRFNPALMLLLLASCLAHSHAAGSGTTSAAKPLLLEKDEGELRVRRPRDVAAPASQFLIKASPKNNGSEHLVLGMEDMPPGAVIPRHKHYGMEEILLIQSGTARVWLGDQERDLHAGGIVFIPRETWVTVKNVGRDPITLAFVFSAPGFDEYLRCTSAPPDETPRPMSMDDWKKCMHVGHAEFEPPRR
jgi:quercetin dioxygenase-like cupin family protein